MTGSNDWALLDRPLNTISFESMSHTNTLLNGLNELRRREYLLDITLLAEGKSFKVISILVLRKKSELMSIIFLYNRHIEQFWLHVATTFEQCLPMP